MDKFQDNGKKLPLLLIGELPAVLLPGAVRADISALGSAPMADAYVIVATMIVDETLDALDAAGCRPDQVLVILPSDRPLRHRPVAGYGIVEWLEGESSEELRARLIARLEAQRQKKLAATLTEAHEAGLSRRLDDSALSLALDAARIAHALACGYCLPPAAHSRAIRAALESGAPAPWTGDLSPERLIPLVSRALAEDFHRGVCVQDAIRERAAGLSFRARTELMHQLESCLGPVLGGRNAA